MQYDYPILINCLKWNIVYAHLAR